MRLSAAALAALAALAVVLGAGGTAHGYPQFQFSTGNTACTDCHFAPAGGGLINEYGRLEAGDTISMAGDGGFLHGLWDLPEAFQIGGDYRGAFLAKEAGGEPELLAFPMQADLYLRAAFGAGISMSVIGGVRGAARGTSADTEIVDRLISREHYLMWERNRVYVRAGRFFAPWGLRVQDHTAYVRRYTGFHTLEETYNVSAGYRAGDWDVHATAFVTPPFLGLGRDAAGGVLYYEKHLRDGTASLGGQARVAVGDGGTRSMAGGTGKLWLEDANILLMTELDLGLQTFDASPGPNRGQLAWYANGTWFARRGLLLGLTFEAWDPDLQLGDNARTSTNVTLQLFPYAHFEVALMGEVEFQGDYGNPATLGMLMLHYYL